MAVLYFVLYVAAFLAFIGAAWAARRSQPPFVWILVPLGLAAWVLVPLIVAGQALND